MRMTMVAMACAAICSGLLVGCGQVERTTAIWTGWSRMCIAGVSYLQFTSGATVEYTPEGRVKTCVGDGQ